MIDVLGQSYEMASGASILAPNNNKLITERFHRFL